MNDSQQNIKKNVLEKIRHGDVVMRPKIYFTLQVIVVAVVAVCAFIASVLVVSFAFFSLHESGELLLLGFGVRGLLTFIALFPWVTLLIAVGLVVLLEWLIRYFKFSYRQPILKVFFVAVCVVCVGGLLITFTPLHTNLSDTADRGDLPFIGQLYEDVHMPHEDKGEFRGVVVSVATSTITITHNDHDADADDGTRVVTVPTNFNTSILHIGDRVYVAGDMTNGTVTAYGLSKF